MKKMILPLLSVMAFITLFAGFMNGPANNGHDKTGSPLSDGKCFQCHSSGSFSPGLSITLMDGEQEVDSYEPGKKYTLKLETTTSGDPVSFGFQTVALNSNNQNAGTFSNIPTGFQQVSLNSASYVEHDSPRPDPMLLVDWTAPSAGDDKVTFFAGTVAANGNNGNSGDGGVVGSLEIQPSTSSYEDLKSQNNPFFSLASNMVSEMLNLKMEAGDILVRLDIIDQQGRLRYSQNHRFSASDELRLPISFLEPGIHFLSVQAGGRIQTVRFLKS